MAYKSGGQSTRDFFSQTFGRFNREKPFVKQATEILARNLDAWAGAGKAVDGAAHDPQWAHLNDVGRKALRRKALVQSFTTNAKDKAAIGRLRKNLEATLPKIPTLEKGDVVGALLDRERRERVLAMPQEKRDALLSSQVSPEILAAVARAEPELSGMSPSVHKMIRAQLIEAGKPQEVADFREATEALDLVDEALRETDRALRDAGDFAHDTEFKGFFDEHVKPVLEKEAPRQIDPSNDVDEMIRRHRQKSAA
jgi:hypothetical protein